MKNTKKDVRLPKNIVPIEYDLELKPDLENFTFSGSEHIYINILKPSKTLTLHSKDLAIDTAHIEINKEKIFAKEIKYQEEKETVVFYFPKTIKTGKNKLHIVFKGILNDKMRGFYKSKYTFDGKEYHMATTQFESTDARRAFPCFDEPAQKSIFNVSLVVPKGKTAISNTLPIGVKEHETGFDIVQFAPTPKMSTYLLAFIVGDFEYIESKTKRGVLVRVFTTPGKKHQANFSLECAIKTLEFYEKYFDIKYPLNTLDMIAIPDFQSAAMENWGAITYRENALLVDEDHSSLQNKQWVALVIAHEIAHQWFGNLVTMEWWTHLWLNEGFASYIEYLAIDKMFPHWDIWTQFSIQDMGIALSLDSLSNTHPIEIKVHHPDEIGEIFDEVSYSKGASIIRMLAGYLGEKDFRDGLRYYLKKHSYKNTETIHLWEAFEKISKKPVRKIMHNWTSKSGYPVLKTRLEKDEIILEQERFFINPISKKANKEKTIWQVPISIGNEKQTKDYLLSTRKAKFKTLQNWQKINIGESGFYRVSYNEELLSRLKKPVQDKVLSARDRLSIIRDLFALAEAGQIETKNIFEFLDAYKNETDYNVWLEISLGIGKLEQIFYGTKIEEKLRTIIIEMFSIPFRKLGWDKQNTDSHTDTLLRSLCISRLGKAKEKNIIKEAKEKFSLFIKEKIKINPDIRKAIYDTVAKNGSVKEYKLLIEKYKKESLHEEQYRISAGIVNFSDIKILQEIASFSMSKHVRKQDTIYMLIALAQNGLARDLWIDFVKKNWKMFESTYGDGGHTLTRLVKAISTTADQKHLYKLEQFFKKNTPKGASRAVSQTLEKIKSNILWKKREERKLEKFFAKE